MKILNILLVITGLCGLVSVRIFEDTLFMILFLITFMKRIRRLIFLRLSGGN